MEYLTKSFHSKFKLRTASNETDNGLKDCLKKLNKWLAKPDQQDVKVDDFNFTTEFNDEPDINFENDITYQYPEDVTCQYTKKVRTKLVIIYHHVKFHYPPNV